MKPFRVLLERKVALEAAIPVHAETVEEARAQARELADGGMVAWVTVNEETSVEVAYD